MHNKQNSKHIITHIHQDLTWFTQDGLRPQRSTSYIIHLESSLTKYAH
jgi:hypothetical protein